jgi:5-methylcytosine-specific restriction endonuclease McrA
MPSPPGYKRDYQQERKTELARGGRRKHTLRLRARRLAVKMGMVSPHDGKDVDHKVPLSKGGSNAVSNLAPDSAHLNRSYPRTKTGAIKGKRD